MAASFPGMEASSAACLTGSNGVSKALSWLAVRPADAAAGASRAATTTAPAAAAASTARLMKAEPTMTATAAAPAAMTAGASQPGTWAPCAGMSQTA